MEKFLISEVPGQKPTPEQVIHNCDLAERLWRERVDPVLGVRLRQWVTKRPLEHFCGAVACFGGHIGLWPEFLAIGGASAPFGEPRLEIDDTEYDVEFVLFGKHNMFDPRDYINEAGAHSDFQVVLDRIAKCREEASRG